MMRGFVISALAAGCVLAARLAEPAEPPVTAGAKPSASVAENASQPAPVKPLDLRIGDIRKYMTPEEFRALSAPADDADTVIVQANVPLVPMKSDLDVPGGLIAPFWALANPHKAWRLFLPDPRVNMQDIPPPESKIPPPVFRWGP
jgi:hypothetical protein